MTRRLTLDDSSFSLLLFKAAAQEEIKRELLSGGGEIAAAPADPEVGEHATADANTGSAGRAPGLVAEEEVAKEAPLEKNAAEEKKKKRKRSRIIPPCLIKYKGRKRVPQSKKLSLKPKSVLMRS